MTETANKIPAGYKQTEIGVIPEDWEVVTYGQAFNFLRTASYSHEQLNGNGQASYIHYGDIHTKWNHFLDFDQGLPTIDDNKVKSYDLIENGDLIVADASEDYEGIGKSVEAKNIKGKRAISGLHTFLLRDTGNFFATGFRGYIHSSKFVKSSMDRLATGLKVYGISKSNLKLVQIPRPPLNEQIAIATALLDADALIEKLERLIEKKKSIKQGAMQELLAGKRRLPGFGEKWQMKKIEEFTTCTSGGTPSTVVATYWGGSLRWMNSGELNLKMIKEVEGRITEQGLHNSSTKMIPKNCVLVGLAGQGKTRGTVAMNLVELCINQSIAAILPSPAFIPEYLYYNLETRYDELRGLSTGDGGRGGLNLTIIRSLSVPFPKIEEQVAISNTLSNMDLEIQKLESQLAKYRNLTQGMMQELLTGRKRLIQNNLVAMDGQRKTLANKGHNWEFNEAVVISALASKFGNKDYPLGRMRYTKLSYLLHRHTGTTTEGYLKKAAGPYNPSTRYKGPETIAQKRGYVAFIQSGKFSGFVSGQNIDQALTYFDKWYGGKALAWLEQFRYEKKESLELLTTVDTAIQELRTQGIGITVEAVKNILRVHPEWKPKLGREIFSDANINQAIEGSQKLFEEKQEVAENGRMRVVKKQPS